MENGPGGRGEDVPGTSRRGVQPAAGRDARLAGPGEVSRVSHELRVDRGRDRGRGVGGHAESGVEGKHRDVLRGGGGGGGGRRGMWAGAEAAEEEQEEDVRVG